MFHRGGKKAGQPALAASHHTEWARGSRGKARKRGGLLLATGPKVPTKGSHPACYSGRTWSRELNIGLALVFGACSDRAVYLDGPIFVPTFLVPSPLARHRTLGPRHPARGRPRALPGRPAAHHRHHFR